MGVWDGYADIFYIIHTASLVLGELAPLLPPLPTRIHPPSPPSLFCRIHQQLMSCTLPCCSNTAPNQVGSHGIVALKQAVLDCS